MMTQPQPGASMNSQQVNDFNSMYQGGGGGVDAPPYWNQWLRMTVSERLALFKHIHKNIK